MPKRHRDPSSGTDASYGDAYYADAFRQMSTIQCHGNHHQTPEPAFDFSLLDAFESSHALLEEREPHTVQAIPGAPIPASSAPRPAMGDHGQEEGWFDGPPIRQVDGDESQRWTPTYSGPGEDMRRDGNHDLQLMDAVGDGHYPTLVPETHRGLMHTDVPQEVIDSMSGLGQDVHNPYELGTGDYNVDEYSIILPHLPPGFDTPEAFLEGFLQDPNEFANDQSATWNPLTTEGLVNDFDFYNEFDLREAGTNNSADADHSPVVGDWYHIDIPGNDGDVVIVDSTSGGGRAQATVQTTTDQEFGPGNDNHPVSGRRQFGIETLSDGTYRFYTRGFDRQTTGLMDVQMSNSAQHADWSSLMRAMAEEHGGHSERQNADGEDVWGWARQIPGDALLSSME